LSALHDLVLGALQGLTEFLPVSSSGHLVLAPYFLRWQEPGLELTVALHLGTLLAVVAFFRREIVAVFATAIRPAAEPIAQEEQSNSAKLETRNSKLETRNLKPGGIGPATLWMIILGTVPAGAMGVALHKDFERLFETPLGVAGFLVVTAALLFLAEGLGASKRSTADMRWWQALVIGFAQGCAIAPGLSRSGATISAGLLLGFERTQATKFAFLLSIPAILGAAIVEFPKGAGFSLAWLPGIAVSALFGYLAIQWVLAAVRKARLRYFAVYCLLVAAAVVAYHFAR